MSVKITGAALAATGLSHFVKPQIYDKLTAVAFPNNTRRHVYIDGAVETAIGVGLIVPQTRKFAVAGIVGYLGYLIFGAVRSRRG